MISVCGKVTLFAECLGAGTVVIKRILFTANLIVSGGLAEYYTFQGVFWVVAMFLKSALLVFGFFQSINLFLGCHCQGGLGVWELSRENELFFDL